MGTCVIQRDPVAAASQRYDAIVVGGGIHGVAMTLEAARRGMRVLLLEKGDFGGATSFNTLRILHGGFRYLQSMDLRRFQESVAERRWFMQHFSDLVRPLPCLMPLYGQGVRRPGILRTALIVNDILGAHRNDGVVESLYLPPGQLLDFEETTYLYPEVDRSGLCGSALWYDAIMLSSERIIMEMLRWACRCGANVLNYVAVDRPLLSGNRIVGVEARDAITQHSFTFEAPLIINCAGPWCGQMAATFWHPPPDLFQPSLAFNLLLDRPSISSCALALTPQRPHARTYFLVPWRGRILVGTFHTAYTDEPVHPRPTISQIEAFLHDINAAAPHLNVTVADVVQVFAGLLPTDAIGDVEPSSRTRIIDHAALGGPEGFVSVSGVKFTTARHVAEQTLRTWFAARRLPLPPYRNATQPDAASRRDWITLFDADELSVSPETIRRIAEEESVVHVDDLLLRRGHWNGTHDEGMQCGQHILDILNWTGEHGRAELERLDRELQCLHGSLVKEVETTR